jgi:hypothetical protein
MHSHLRSFQVTGNAGGERSYKPSRSQARANDKPIRSDLDGSVLDTTGTIGCPMIQPFLVGLAIWYIDLAERSTREGEKGALSADITVPAARTT